MKTTDDPGPFHTEPTETAVCDTGKYFKENTLSCSAIPWHPMSILWASDNVLNIYFLLNLGVTQVVNISI